MPVFDEKHVKICGGTVVWDGVTQPEAVTVGARAGGFKWALKVVFEPHNQDLALYSDLANKALLESKWRGQLPAQGRMPLGTVQPGEFNDMFPGWCVISFKTTLKLPDVYDENGKLLDPMQLSHVVYTGQKVDVLAHCYEYDAMGNKGIAAGLDGFAVILSAQAQRIQIGTGGVNTAQAFGGGGGQQQPAYGGGQQQPAYGGGQQQPAYGGGQQQPVGNEHAGPAGGHQGPPGYTTGSASTATTYPSNPPQQAHNFLPQR